MVEIEIWTPWANPANRRDAALDKDRGQSGSIEAFEVSKAASNRRVFVKMNRISKLRQTHLSTWILLPGPHNLYSQLVY